MVDLGASAARYDVIRIVSDGPRATVLHAIDTFHHVPVALKAYPVGDGNRDEILAEARILMSIAPHPALPVVRGDFFTERDTHYVLVINWIDGTGVDEFVESTGPLPLDEATAIASRIADALDHLHAHDPPIVHGDVKPANIIRTIGGDVALVDFDIASAQSSPGRLGTIGYVAPEVAAGDKATPSSDVYGLAATIVALLTGAAPSGVEPQLAGVELATRDRLIPVLKRGLAADPEKRHASAGRLVSAVRAAAHPDHRSGVLAFLATEVVDASRLWAVDAQEMEAALARLNDIRDLVLEQFDGQLVTSMNEGDRTLVVFHSAASAGLAALRLHDELRNASMPDGFELRLRAAVAVGEARLIGGSYAGAVVDQLLRLRASAPSQATLVSERTAELLIGLVGREATIVPLDRSSGADDLDGQLFALLRPGASVPEPTLAREDEPPPWPPPQPAAASLEHEPAAAIDRWEVASDVALNPLVLGAVTVVGVALIYSIVLGPEFGGTSIASAIVFVFASLALASGAVLFHREMGERRAAIAAAAQERADAAEAEIAVRERLALRDHLRKSFSHLGSDDAERAQRVLADLGSEYDVAVRGVERHRLSLTGGAGSRVPSLLGDTYRHGISALSDALELFESGDSSRNRRLARELEAIEERLRGADGDDAAERARDEMRAASHRKLLARRQRTAEHGRELVFEAERCTNAIAEARIEIATVRVNDTQAVVDTVVQSLEETIQRVRRLQDEVRRLER